MLSGLMNCVAWANNNFSLHRCFQSAVSSLVLEMSSARPTPNKATGTTAPRLALFSMEEVPNTLARSIVLRLTLFKTNSIADSLAHSINMAKWVEEHDTIRTARNSRFDVVALTKFIRNATSISPTPLNTKIDDGDNNCKPAIKWIDPMHSPHTIVAGQRKHSQPVSYGVCIRAGHKIFTNTDNTLRSFRDPKLAYDDILKRSGILTRSTLRQISIGPPLVINLDNARWALYDIDKNKLNDIGMHTTRVCNWHIIYNLYAQVFDDKEYGTTTHRNIVKWLQQNVARDRWKLDCSLHHIPRGGNTDTPVIQHPHAIQRLATLTTQCDRDMTEYQMAQHDMDYETQQRHTRTTTLTAGQRDTNAADIRVERKQATIDDYHTHKDLRTQCRQRGFSPLYAYMYVGDMYDKSKRKRIKVMFDSGCSLVVASKQFIDSLNREVMDSNLTLQTNASLPGATSAYGDHKNSCGIVDLGETILNSNPHTRDSTPSMNMLLSAYVFEDLSADLILGTPVWFDWVHAISWRQAHGAASHMSSIRLSSGGGDDHIDWS